jgi:hypothetical protein
LTDDHDFVMLARMSKEAKSYPAQKMQASRRSFIRQAVISAGALGLGQAVVESAEQPAGSGNAAAPKMRLGLVTYNLAKDWDIPTIIRNCEQTGFEGVELRTTHAHGVEVTLTRAQRDEVRRRFQDSKVVLMGLGSAFDYHTPDQAKLQKDIEATKEYIILAHDVVASGVKVRPNALPRDVPVEKTLEQIGRALRELGEFADGYGQQIRL